MTKEQLSDGWSKCSLPDLCRMVMGQSPPSSTYNTEQDGLPFFQGKKEFGELYPTVAVWCNTPNKIAEPQSILLSVRAPVGPTNIAPQKCCIGRGLAALHPYDGVERDYLLYLLRGMERDLSGEGTGSTFDAVTKKFLESYEVVLAPTVEQHAIVAKIECLFSELDQGVAQLESIQKQLKRYRQSVLKAAFEGKLTKEWRDQLRTRAKASGKPLPTTDDLLDQIKAERETHYKQRLDECNEAIAQWEANGGKNSSEKKPRKPAKPKNPPPLTAEDLEKLPELPDGWVWCRIGELLNEIFDGPFGSSLKTADYVSSGVPVVRLENIGVQVYRNEKQSFVSEDKYESLSRHWLSPGDIVFSSFITDEVRACTVPDSIPRSINKADCFCLRPAQSVKAKFLCQSFGTRYFYHNIAQSVHGATRPRVNTTQLREAIAPLCGAEEQALVLDEIDARLSVVDQAEQEIVHALKQADLLRQSILKNAFAGRLLTNPELAQVRAHPDYETAEQLLKRIKDRHNSVVKSPKIRKSRSHKSKRNNQKRERSMTTSLDEYLKSHKDGVSPEKLFDECGYTPDTVDDFYRALRSAIEAGIIAENRGADDSITLVTNT
jgi:type I restriction enzyme, S subunit